MQPPSKLQIEVATLTKVANGRCNHHQSCNTKLQLKAKLQTQGPRDCNFDGSCNSEDPGLQLGVKLQPKVATLIKVATSRCNFTQSCNTHVRKVATEIKVANTWLRICNYTESCKHLLQLYGKLQAYVATLIKIANINCNFDRSCKSALQL